MNPFWSNFVKGLDPYVPGEQPKGDDNIKLNTNENPYPPSPKVIAAIADEAGERLRLYPDPESLRLKEVIAKYYGVLTENVFVGNGSDEVLAHAFNTFFRQANPVLFPDVTYSFYPIYCGLYDISYVAVPLDSDFKIDIDGYLQANGGIIFPNPNAPTSIGLGRNDIVKLLENNNNSVVIIDEAYIDFADPNSRLAIESSVALTQKYKNLLVVQTLSKSRSLAGIRLGFAIGNAGLIEGLQRVKNTFNSYPVDRLAEVAAIASFEDEDYFASICGKIVASRESLIMSLQALGFSCLPSSANFVMVKHENVSANTLAVKLRENDIIVRYFAKPRIDEYLRITIGSNKDNAQLLKALDSILNR